MNTQRILIAASMSFCALCAVLAGCTSSDSGDNSDVFYPPKKGSGAAEVLLKEVEEKGYGTITGVVTYDGTPPERKELAGIAGHQDRSVCFQGDVKDQTWMVDAGGGVGNVVVWVSPPNGHYFKKPDKNKTWQDAVVVDQPYCAFIPHVVVLYPQHYDGKQRVPTGQVLRVKNSATIGHNIKIAGSSLLNPASGSMLATGKEQVFTPRVDTQALSMNCDVHKWMTGYAMTFDHPYAVLTNAKGEFTIKNVPAGSELTLMAWHEDLQKFVPVVAGGNKFTLQAGETKKLDFKISKK